jgi:dTDP-glucose 4,6-dehydratase
MFESAASKKIAVVTGGAGFLGSHLSDRLIAEGFRVIAIDNLVTGSPDNVAHLAGNRDFKFVRHNVSEFIFIPGTVDYVFHFASPASPIDYLELPIPTLKVGALGTHNALGLAKEKNAVFVLASTSECYGDPWCILKTSTIGEMSTRSARAGYTMKPNVLPKPLPWLTIGITR